MSRAIAQRSGSDFLVAALPLVSGREECLREAGRESLQHLPPGTGERARLPRLRSKAAVQTRATKIRQLGQRKRGGTVRFFTAKWPGVALRHSRRLIVSRARRLPHAL